MIVAAARFPRRVGHQERTLGCGERQHRRVQEIAGPDSEPHVARVNALLPRQRGGVPRRIQSLETEVFETALNAWRLRTVRFVNRRYRARSGCCTDGLLATGIARGTDWAPFAQQDPSNLGWARLRNVVLRIEDLVDRHPPTLFRAGSMDR